MAITVGCKPINMGSIPVLVFGHVKNGRSGDLPALVVRVLLLHTPQRPIERVAQLVEHWSSKSQVKGSSPFSFAIKPSVPCLL